jgi:TetR/AcrR family transcriptional regulator, transcriptional repressor for nem operon
MTKGEQTRRHIVQEAATLFNQRGYSGSSISDVMQCTGLQKGGIYRHFQSKEQLAIAAFDYAQQQSTARLVEAVRAETDPVQQLLAFINAFHALTLDPPVPGGCPILNTIVDSDDGDPVLRERVVAVVTGWEQLIERIVADGIARGSVRSDIDPQAVSTLLIANLEGGILLARAHRSSVYLQRAVDHLVQYIQRDVAAQ